MALINKQTAARIAGLEVNSLLAAGVLPPSRFQETRVSASPTPVYDLNGEVLFQRVPILRGRVTDSYADIAAYPVFGGLLLRVATGFAWDEKALLKAAETALRKQKRNAKLAASMKAQARYLLPFLVLPSPFFLPLLRRWLSTQRAYEAKLPAAAKRSMGPVSSTMTVARMRPTPGMLFSKAYSGHSPTLS